MHALEPYYNWRHLYITSEDEESPFYGYQNSEMEFTHAIYNYIIHPQWDSMGSPTLFLKILYVNYEEQCAIIEFIGEWNDSHHDDISTLKQDIINPLLEKGIVKFILIGENILILHPDDDSYYEEWFDDSADGDGWIALINFREHVLESLIEIGVDQYFLSGGKLSDMAWRTKEPDDFIEEINGLVYKRLG